MQEFLFFQIFRDFPVFCVCTSLLVPVNLAIYTKGLTTIDISGCRFNRAGAGNKGNVRIFQYTDKAGYLVLIRSASWFGRSSVAAVAQSVERVLGKDEVMGPNPISS